MRGKSRAPSSPGEQLPTAHRQSRRPRPASPFDRMLGTDESWTRSRLLVCAGGQWAPERHRNSTPARQCEQIRALSIWSDAAVLATIVRRSTILVPGPPRSAAQTTVFIRWPSDRIPIPVWPRRPWLRAKTVTGEAVLRRDALPPAAGRPNFRETRSPTVGFCVTAPLTAHGRYAHVDFLWRSLRSYRFRGLRCNQ